MLHNFLVLIDIQKEYTTEGRPFYLNGIEPSLAKCRQLLNFARQEKWNIIHIQHSNGVGATRFDPQTEYYDFVEGFEPLSTEKHFVKHDYSCYSNNEFTNYMLQLEQAAQSKKQTNNIYLIGYNTVMCCLSTLEEARRKKQSGVQLIADATYAKAIGKYHEQQTHEFMLALIETKKLAPLVFTEKILYSHSK